MELAHCCRAQESSSLPSQCTLPCLRFGSVRLVLHSIMPSLALCSSFLQFAAPTFTPRARPLIATPRRASRHLSTSTYVAVESTMSQKPFTMSLSATEAVVESDDLSSLSHIMEPIHEGDRDLLLVFCPGAFKPSEGYFPLMHMIQAQLSLRLWIVVLHNTNKEALSTTKIDVTLTKVLPKLQQRGFRSSRSEMQDTFIAGHSIGAYLARAVAVRRAQAFIQLGSNFDLKLDSLAQYPKPVLTVGGGLDGQMTPAIIASHAAEVLDTEPDLGPHNTYAVKPVIIIPGMNHAQFCDGQINVERGDLPPTISIEDAQQRTAELIAAFLAVQAATEDSTRDLEILSKAVDETHRRYKPLWEALRNATHEAVAHQLHVASPSKLSAENVTIVRHDFSDNFVISKPYIDAKMNNQVIVMTYLNPTKRRNLSNLWVKMKLREAVLQHYESQGDRTVLIQALGKESNSKTFEVALSLVSDDDRELFLKQGKKLRFVDDWLCPPPATTWVESDLSFTPTPSGDVEVQSPVLTSPMEMPPRYAGMHYMKVLTLATAIHWILVDAFR